MGSLKANQKISNSSTVIKELENAGFRVAHGEKTPANARFGLSSIVGKRTKPLVIKY